MLQLILQSADLNHTVSSLYRQYYFQQRTEGKYHLSTLYQSDHISGTMRNLE